MEDNQPSIIEQEIEYRKEIVKEMRAKINFDEMSDKEREEMEKVLLIFGSVSPLRQKLVYKTDVKLVNET